MVKRVLMLLVGGLLLAVTPTLAQPMGDFLGLTVADSVLDTMSLINLASIENETTVGLTQNEWDYLFEPAELGALKGWKRDRNLGNKWDASATDEGGWFLITNLANNSEQDSYQIGTWGRLGPGNMAFIAAYTRYKEDYRTRSASDWADAFDFDGDDTADTIGDDNSHDMGWSGKYEDKATDLYVAYGWPIGDDKSLGFSLRHTQWKYFYAPASDNWQHVDSWTDYYYDESGNVSEVDEYDAVSYERWDSRRKLTRDTLAAEFKMWPADDWSLKFRLQYGKAKSDVIDRYGYGAAQSYLYTDTLGPYFALDQSYDLDQYVDVSWDGNEWGLGAKLNWYFDAGDALQVDAGYWKGDYDAKNAVPLRYAYDASYLYQLDLGSGLQDIENIQDGTLGQAALSAQDISSTRWLLGAKYLWQWGQADLILGLRYWSDKAEASLSGPLTESWQETDTYLWELPSTYYTDVESLLYRGAMTDTGEIKTRWLQLPVAAVLHVNDKLDFRFGAQHTLYKYEAEGVEDWLWNYFSWQYVSNDVVLGSYEDPVSFERSRYAVADEYEDTFTTYRAGLQYKFNEHLIAELMASETTGGASNREKVGLDKLVAGVTLRF